MSATDDLAADLARIDHIGTNLSAAAEQVSEAIEDLVRARMAIRQAIPSLQRVAAALRAEGQQATALVLSDIADDLRDAIEDD